MVTDVHDGISGIVLSLHWAVGRVRYGIRRGTCLGCPDHQTNRHRQEQQESLKVKQFNILTLDKVDSIS